MITGSVVAVLLAVAGRYGWHRDELYFLEAGHHLDWGYIDQPPFTPFVARLADEVARHNLVVLRLAPAIAAGMIVVLGAVFLRELGASRRAQVGGAGVVAASGFVLGAGHLLSTSTFDLLAWMGALVLVTRLLRTDEPRWWAPIGAVVGVAMLNKHLIVILVVSVVVALLVERRWRLVVTPWAVTGVGLALVLAAPNLAWQAANGWPQLDMADALAERLAGENRATLLPLQVLFFGPLVMFLLWRGAAWLGRHPETHRLRPLLWAWPIRSSPNGPRPSPTTTSSRGSGSGRCWPTPTGPIGTTRSPTRTDGSRWSRTSTAAGPRKASSVRCRVRRWPRSSPTSNRPSSRPTGHGHASTTVLMPPPPTCPARPRSVEPMR